MRKRFASLVLLMLLAACSFLPSQAEEPPVQPEVTITSVVIPFHPSSTPAPSFTPTRVFFPTASVTPTVRPSSTAILSPSATGTQTPVPVVERLPYQAQLGSPRYMASFREPTLGCQWMGIAGQVFSSDGSPVKDIMVFASGAINGSPVNASGITGQISDYGDGSYEIKLSDAPFDTMGTITVQLFDMTIKPLSDPVSLSTSADCAKNLILLNFQPGAAAIASR